MVIKLNKARKKSYIKIFYVSQNRERGKDLLSFSTTLMPLLLCENLQNSVGSLNKMTAALMCPNNIFIWNKTEKSRNFVNCQRYLGFYCFLISTGRCTSFSLGWKVCVERGGTRGTFWKCDAIIYYFACVNIWYIFFSNKILKKLK